jgi:uncharacterized C2H2 Zn-finger protein
VNNLTRRVTTVFFVKSFILKVIDTNLTDSTAFLILPQCTTFIKEGKPYVKHYVYYWRHLNIATVWICNIWYWLYTCRSDIKFSDLATRWREWAVNQSKVSLKCRRFRTPGTNYHQQSDFGAVAILDVVLHLSHCWRSVSTAKDTKIRPLVSPCLSRRKDLITG